METKLLQDTNYLVPFVNTVMEGLYFNSKIYYYNLKTNISIESIL